MIQTLSILLCLAFTFSFAPQRQTKTVETRTFMFNKDDKKAPPLPTAAPLQTVDEAETKEEGSPTEPGMVVKDMNTGEVKQVNWVDPAMSANTNPFALSWWGYFFFLPIVIIFNDFFHFLPTEGPLAFLSQI